MSEPQKVKLLNSPIIARLKALGVNINMSSKEYADWDDTPFNRVRLWYKHMSEERTGVFLPSCPFGTLILHS